MTDSLREISKFLTIQDRLDLKTVALTNILGITGTHEGITVLIALPDLLISLLRLLSDPSESVSKDAALCLINISASEKGAEVLLSLKLQDTLEDVVAITLKFILDPESHISDPCCMIISNVSRNSGLVETVIDLIEKSKITFDVLIGAFTKNKYNQKGANLHYLGPFLSNLSQSSRVRKYILDRDKCVIQRLIAFTEYKDSNVRRGGVIGTLKNCCFDIKYHSWLLSEEVDILPRLLLPLAGNTEYDEDDNDKLPPELQYLPDDKEREEDPDIRCMLLESIIQLCALRKNRQYVRDKNAYVILRELHKWEKDRKALLACENLVDILIRTENEIGEDNLKAVDIPDHLRDRFTKMDEEFLSET